jgi:hypothetical protein
MMTVPHAERARYVRIIKAKSVNCQGIERIGYNRYMYTLVLLPWVALGLIPSVQLNLEPQFIRGYASRLGKLGTER